MHQIKKICNFFQIFPQKSRFLNPLEIWSIVYAVLADMPFFLKVEPMRTNTPPGARNFAEVVFPDYFSGNAPHGRGTDAALGGKKAKCLEAVPLKTAKYQALNGRNPAFFLEPERYKGTN